MIPVLARYVGRAILSLTFLVMAVLLILFALYLFYEEQNDIGEGSYGVTQALLFALFSLPRYVFDVLPIGALIGALLGLGNLSRSSELAVMRASGVSVMRIGWWAAMAGILLAAITWIIGDYVSPPLEQYARQMKTFAKYKEVSLTANQSAWAKDGNTFISVQQQSAQNQFGGVYVFRFDDQHRLQSVGRATRAEAQDGQQWQLYDYTESQLQPHAQGMQVVASRTPQHTLDTTLSPEFLGLAVTEPDALPGRVLWGYIRHLRANGQDSRLYETALWARIARTTALIFVVMLAVPFALGSARSGNAGVRTVIGVLVGVAFFMLAKMLENGGQVFNLAPWVVAWTPTLLMAAVAMIALARAR
jgi:lipopolysaccharide export system permease protein